MTVEVRIETQRLHMISGKRSDAPDLAAFLSENRPRFEPWMPEWPNGFDSEEGCKQRLCQEYKERQSGQSLRLYLRLKSDPYGPIVGTCALFSIQGQEHAELGFQMTKKLEGQGLAREAALAIIDHGFHQRQIKKLVAIILEKNSRSLVLIERLGFVFARKLNDIFTIDGQEYDHLQFELFRDDYLGQ